MEQEQRILAYQSPRPARRRLQLEMLNWLTGAFGLGGLVLFAPTLRGAAARTVLETFGPTTFLIVWAIFVSGSITVCVAVWNMASSRALRMRSFLDVAFVVATFSPWGVLKIWFIVEVCVRGGSWLGGK